MSLTITPASTGRIAVADAASIQDLSVGTAMVLFNTTNDDKNARYLVCKGNASSVGWRFGGRTNNTTRLFATVFTDGTDYALLPAGNAYTVGEWTWAAFVWDVPSDVISIYVGTLTTPMALYGTTTGGTGSMDSDAGEPLVIGNASGFSSTNSWDDPIAVSMVFNRALTLEEMISLQFNPRNTSGLVAGHKLGDNGTGTQNDFSGNGNNGTVTGATQSDNPPIARWRRKTWQMPYRVVTVGAGSPYYYLRRRRMNGGRGL